MENQEQQTAPQAAPSELTITDLQNLRSIIDAASRRGAFGAAEMSGVGATYTRLDNFLNSVAAAQQQATPDAPQEPPAA